MYVEIIIATYVPVTYQFSTLGNGSAILSADTTQISHGLHDNHTRKEPQPQRGEHQVGHWACRACCCCLLVQVPHLMFSGAFGEELDIRPLVPQELGQKGPSHGLLLC